MSRANPRFKRINPPLPLVGTTNGVVLYRIIGSIEGQLTINTFTYSAAVPAPTATQLATLLANLSTAVKPNYTACLSADWTTTSETIAVVHRNDLFGATRLTNAGVAGGRTTIHVPTEVGAVIIKQSAVKGQHGRGRITLPAIANADVTGSKIAAATEITALNNLATAMLATASDGTNTWTPCVSQRSLATPRLVIGFSPLTAVTPNLLLGTVRRRKLGRGK